MRRPHRLAALAACLGSTACVHEHSGPGQVNTAPPPPNELGFWEDRPSLTIARGEVGAALLDGKVYVGGGLPARGRPLDSVERYDPTNGTWTLVQPMPTVRHHFGMTTAAGKIFVVGGYTFDFVGVDTVFAYDPATDQWTPRAPLPRPRGAFVAVTIGDLVYAVGGVDPLRGVVGDLTVYDPATDRWTTLTPMPTPREHIAAAAVAGKLCVAGGRQTPNQAVFEIYDPATDTWTRGPDMPTARSGNGGAALDGKFLVFGGEGSANYPQTEEYDPATETWRSLAPMSTPLHGIYPVTIGDEVLIGGGGTQPGQSSTAIALAYRRQPGGVSRYGVSTPSCAGPISIGAERRPLAGDPNFTLHSLHAPPGASGVLALNTVPDVAGRPLLNVVLFLGASPPIVSLAVTATAGGSLQQPVPLIGSSRGAAFYAQFLWANTPSCTNGGPMSASDALAIKVQ